ncbi:LysR family transcriptional regulator ArgP [Cognatishimia sp. WU-CL00825]|uniref:LysR family transcriptional regulator ArgP n=1 Tax=Cognatishimia sp. WU-CL00825 TaxID=3127658 RepID=UPI0031022071
MQYDYHQLATLAAILRLGSFEAAAAELAVTQSAISQRLKALEERTGALLVHRGQPCTGTALGTRLAAHHGHVALLEHQLNDDLQTRAALPKGRLRLVVNADSLASWFMPAIANVSGILYDLVIDDQEFSVDLLRRGEVGAAVTSHGGVIAGCECYYLGRLVYRATSSPKFCARYFPTQATKQSLRHAPMLRYNSKDDLQNRWLRTQVGTDDFSNFHMIASTQGFIDASLAGLGWGMNPALMVDGHIAAGRLQEIIPDTALDTPLFWQCNRLLAPALKPLTRSICQTAHKHLPQ